MRCPDGCDDGCVLCTSAEMAGELGAFAGTEEPSHMLRVMRNHRNAAYGATTATRSWTSNLCRWIMQTALMRDLTSWRWPLGTRRWNWVKSTATATRSPR